MACYIHRLAEQERRGDFLVQEQAIKLHACMEKACDYCTTRSDL